MKKEVKKLSSEFKIVNKKLSGMPALIEYLIKLSICLTVVFVFYQLFLRRLTFYNWNRWYLIGYSVMSFFIPLFDIMPQLQKREIATATIINWIPVWNYAAPKQSILATLSVWDWVMIVLALGALFFLVRFISRLYSFLLIRKKATLVTKHQTSLYQLDENITPFSFGNAIFINRHLHSQEELAEIMRHEFVHVKQKHTIDIIFTELLCITNWFNPFAWLIRYGIRQNLEFIADDKVVQNGFDKKEYQYLLLKVMGDKRFTFTNHFNFSNLKKRIAMMNTVKTAKVHLIKFLFLLPVVAVLLLSFRKEIQRSELKTPVTFIKDTVPDSDSGYKISVITTPGNFNNEKMPRTVVERMSVEDWNNNKEFYEKKYGQSISRINEKVYVTNKDGKEIRYDSVYVTKYKPKPIKPGEEPLIVVNGKELPYATLNSISPEDIESMKVLKDAAAMSLYDEKGKNGVIIIETKKAKAENGKQADPSNDLKAEAWEVSIKNEEGLKASQKLNEVANYFQADSLTLHTNGTVTISGNVSGVIVPGIKLENIDASQKVPKSSEPVIVNGYKIEKNSTNKQPLMIAVDGNKNPYIVLDGVEVTNDELKKVKPESIKAVSILKDKSAAEKYGDKGKNGVVEISTKKSTEK